MQFHTSSTNLRKKNCSTNSYYSLHNQFLYIELDSPPKGCPVLPAKKNFLCKKCVTKYHQL